MKHSLSNIDRALRARRAAWRLWQRRDNFIEQGLQLAEAARIGNTAFDGATYFELQDQAKRFGLRAEKLETYARQLEHGPFDWSELGGSDELSIRVASLVTLIGELFAIGIIAERARQQMALGDGYFLSAGGGWLRLHRQQFAGCFYLAILDPEKGWLRLPFESRLREFVTYCSDERNRVRGGLPLREAFVDKQGSPYEGLRG